jgi:hypothetical protein
LISNSTVQPSVKFIFTMPSETDFTAPYHRPNIITSKVPGVVNHYCCASDFKTVFTVSSRVSAWLS